MLHGCFATVRIKSEGTKKGKPVLLAATSLVLLSQLLKIKKMFLSQSAVLYYADDADSAAGRMS